MVYHRCQRIRSKWLTFETLRGQSTITFQWIKFEKKRCAQSVTLRAKRRKQRRYFEKTILVLIMVIKLIMGIHLDGEIMVGQRLRKRATYRHIGVTRPCTHAHTHTRTHAHAHTLHELLTSSNYFLT